MKHNLETQLEELGQHVTLSDSEKSFHRAKLLMAMRPKAPIRSPYSSFLFMGARYAFVAFLILVLGSSGVAFASEKALPGNPLYVVKVKLTEPVQVALTLDPKKKTAFEVSLVNKRLSEVAQASLQGTAEGSDLTLATDSLTENINATQKDIATLQAAHDTDSAFETASDLKAVFDVHAKILDRVQATDPAQAPAIEAVAATLQTESDQTDSLVASTTDAVENTDPVSLDQPANDQEDDTLQALTKVKADIDSALASLDTSDRADVNDALADINATIADAKEKDDAGDVKGAYLLYVEAEQKIGELQTVLQADQNLGVDVIDASTTSDQ